MPEADAKKPFRVMYDYTDVPTLKRFALDNSRVRLAMGPFASGKSSACVMEIVRRAHMQSPGPDGIRRTRWVVVRNCYDDQTEILTEKRGWQLFRDLTPEDKVATLRNGFIDYKLPNSIVVHPYEGEMLGFDGENVNFLVTPDHKMYVSMRRTRQKIWCDYEIKTAEEIYGNQLVRVKKDAKWVGEETKHSVSFFEFLGFWFAEGSCGEYWYEDRNTPRRNLNITQKKNVEYAERLLSANNIFYRRDEKGKTKCYTYDLSMDKLLSSMFSEFLSFGKQPVRHVPLWIKNAPPSHLKAFITGYMMGDGTPTSEAKRMFTCSKQLADDLQEICLKAGMVANVSINDKYVGRETILNGNRCVVKHPSYIVTLMSEKRYHPVLHVCQRNTNHLKGWYKEQYSGNVYCVGMEDIPVYVRRKGKAFWCLRSYVQLRDTTIKTFMDWFPPKIFGTYRVTDHSYFITKFPGVQIEIMFRALDRPDQVANLLSLEVTGAWFNEAREIPQTIIEAMDARIGRYPSKRDGGASWYGIIMDTNPPDDDSYLYRMFEVVQPSNWKIFKQPSGLSTHAENTKHLVKNYYTNLAKGKDPMYIRIYIHGQYGYLVQGKPVYEGFKDNIHVAPHPLEPIKGLPLLLGFDFGLQPCCTIGQINPALGQLMILDELVSDGMGIKQFCLNQLLPLLRLKYFGFKVRGYGDPAGSSRSQTDESTCFEILHGKDIGLMDIESAYTNAITARVGAVEHFLNSMSYGEPCFILSPTCKHLRRAMNGGYHYEKDQKGNGEYKLVPVKNYDCVDMETEILTLDGWKTRDDIKEGDEVFGYKNGVLIKDRIEKLFDYQGNIECIKFSTPMYEFVFTGNHRCFAFNRLRKGALPIPIEARKINQCHSFITTALYKENSHKPLMTNWLVKLCAWVFTEGTYRKDGSIVIGQSITHNPQYVHDIDKLLKGSIYLVNRCVYNDIVRWKINKELAILIRYLMPKKYPSPEFVMKMRTSQRRLFLYEALRGDGFNGGPMPDKDEITRSRDFWLDRHYKTGGKITPRLTMPNKKEIDIIQMIATLVGIETHIQTKRQSHRSDCFDLSFINKDRINTGRMKKEKVIVDKVWCPKTSSGAWVMRRKGIVLITGNSHIADSLQYLALYVVNDQGMADKRKGLIDQLGKRTLYRPASNLGGY